VSNSLIIRPVQTRDYPRWLPLWDGYNEFYGRWGDTALPQEVTDVTWGRFFDSQEPMHALVAEVGDTLVGVTHFLFHRATTRIEPTCYLNDLFTSPAARGRGVATALIDGVCDAARGKGCKSIYWLTHETNAKARGLYDKVADNSGFLRYVKST
jgi:GNAT superfamily N-acetyltransferase